MSFNEQNLWENIKQGDIRAYESLFNTFYKGLYGYAYDFLRNKEDSEEIILDLFTEIWTERLSIEIHTSIKAYLYRGIHNKCINFIKHAKLTRERFLQYNSETTRSFELLLNKNEEFALDKLISGDLEKIYENAVASLSDQCREVFHLSRFKQMKISEIAALMNISENTAKTYLTRALNKLREVLGKHLS